MSEPFPCFVTKWCLSSGIEEATAWEFPGNDEWCVIASGRLRGFIMQSGQWHRTKAAAVKAANAILARTIKAQRERLEELESVHFTLEDGNERTGNSDGEGAGRSEGGAEGRGEPGF